MSFEILSCNGQDAAKWTELVHGLPAPYRDIHYLPEYGRIYAKSYGFTPFLAVFRNAVEYVLQPFVRRPLNELPFLAGLPDAGIFTDIANPYGYGGPLCSSLDQRSNQLLYAAFSEAFSIWCEEEKIASEFGSFHPFIAPDQSAMVKDFIEPAYQKDVIFIDLTIDEASMLGQLRKGHRSSIARARKSGVTVEKAEPSAANLAEFRSMYQSTMTRRQAAERWFLPDDYFANCITCLGEGRATLLFARVEGRIESGCLLIYDFTTAYYHFAGTWMRHPELGVNNLIVLEAAIRAKRAGFTKLHLGGGVTSSHDDTLLRFKAGFSDRRAALYTYFCVRDRKAYDLLCDRKRAHERATAGVESSSDFLPVYRR